MFYLFLKLKFLFLKSFQLAGQLMTVLVVLLDFFKNVFSNAVALVDLFADEI